MPSPTIPRFAGCNLTAASGALYPAYETSVVVHELGHLFGLVNLTGKGAFHEDPEHRGHSSSADSVMYWATEDISVGNVFRGGPLNRDHLRSSEVHSTTIGVTDLNLAACEETHMCVHAQISADNRFHVRGPAKSGRVDYALHTTRARRDDVDCYTSNFTALGVFYRRKQ